MGRPRIHVDNAARQKAYRERLKEGSVTKRVQGAELPPVAVTQSEGKPTSQEK
jgi:hypothetical protein